MSIYAIIVFLHILGALGLVNALGFELACLIRIRNAATPAQVREWAPLWRAGRALEAAAGLLLLASGITLSVQWGGRPWVVLGLLSLLLIGAMGGLVTRGRFEAVFREAGREEEASFDVLARRVDDPMLRLAVWLRLLLTIGVVSIMSMKPGTVGSVVALAIAVAAGTLAGVRRSRPGPAAPAFRRGAMSGGD